MHHAKGSIFPARELSISKIKDSNLILQSNFRGECILYADVIEEKIEFGPLSKCNFITYLHVLLSVVYGALLAGLYTTMTYKRFKEKDLQ